MFQKSSSLKLLSVNNKNNVINKRCIYGNILILLQGDFGQSVRVVQRGYIATMVHESLIVLRRRISTVTQCQDFPLREIQQQLDLCRKRSPKRDSKKWHMEPRLEILGLVHRCQILQTPPPSAAEPEGAHKAPVGTVRAQMPRNTEWVGGECPTALDGWGMAP